MEKMIYLVWKRENESDHDFRNKLTEETAQQLLGLGVHRLSIAVSDDDVDPAASLRTEATKPPISGILSMWVDTAIRCRPLEALIQKAVARTAGFLVTESEPLANTAHTTGQGRRTPGMCQVVLFRKPPRLNYDHWLELWLGKHTKVALETQSTFGYRQNVVVRPLTYAAPLYDAIVEEYFPAAAMTDPMVFYDAAGDKDKLEKRQKAMFESVARFIDFDKFDRIPMSEYIIKA
jgi:hypothetical protein